MSESTNWMERWQAALREQHKVLFDYKTKNLQPEYAEYIDCPVCGSSDFEEWFEKDWFRHVRCQNCSMVYLNPRMNMVATHSFYNSSVNAIYNETKFDQVSSSTTLDDQINLDNLQWLDEIRQGKKGNLLEVGSAKGYFLLKAKDAGYDVHGLELNRPNYEYSRRLLGDTILDKDLSDAHFEDSKFDVVYMRDVIEHLPEPLSFLKEVNRVLKPGGMIFLDTHNVDGWIYRIARERHTVFFGFEHPNHWSPRTLGNALARCGFVVRKVKLTSLDFTLRDILNYMLVPGFTAIYPAQPSRMTRLLVKLLLLPFHLKPVRGLDKTIFPRLANLFGRGSVMKIVAEKAKTRI